MRRLIEPSHLDLCCLQKTIIIACGSERVKCPIDDDFRMSKKKKLSYLLSDGLGPAFTKTLVYDVRNSNNLFSAQA